MSSSRMIRLARPRNSASVPMVTTSDGSAKRTINRPLKAPASAPAPRAAARHSASGRSASIVTPKIAADSASTDAIERSISAAITIVARPSAITARSAKVPSASHRLEPVRNTSDCDVPKMIVATNRATRKVSQRASERTTPLMPCSGPTRSGAGSAAC